MFETLRRIQPSSIYNNAIIKKNHRLKRKYYHNKMNIAKDLTTDDSFCHVIVERNSNIVKIFIGILVLYIIL